jgi:hypothetical protein
VTQLAPFDPSDPFEAVADKFRRTVAAMGLVAISDPGFRSLQTDKAAEAFTAGILTGLMGVLFSTFVSTNEAHDEIEAFVVTYIKQARAQAEGIMAQGETRQ